MCTNKTNPSSREDRSFCRRLLLLFSKRAVTSLTGPSRLESFTTILSLFLKCHCHTRRSRKRLPCQYLSVGLLLDFLQLPGKYTTKKGFLLNLCLFVQQLVIFSGWIRFYHVARLSLNALRPSKINTRKSIYCYEEKFMIKKKNTDHFFFFYLRWVNIGSAVRSGRRSRKNKWEKVWLISIMKAAEIFFLRSRTHTRKCQYYTLHFIRTGWEKIGKESTFTRLARLLH